jgi:phenylalanyl-tRNA synthetase beta chain
MKVSLNWLKRYIDIDLPIERISEILTDIGLEVEGLEKVESIKGGLQGIVVGHIVECGKHPNADKLSVTKVDIGEGEPVQIVCGAPNVGANQKVLVATIGTTLYDEKGEPFKIKRGKMRGEESLGMICAEDELGLGSSHDGIMILADDLPIGLKASEHFKLEDDYVFEIGLTPNRSDATCHLGVAKDLAAYLKINEGWTGSIKEPVIEDFNIEGSVAPLTVKVHNQKACPRYSGISLTDIKVGESPKWMQQLLRAIGVRPISNIVDITNFVLHEMGQPLHAFDQDKIKDQTINVKTLSEGSLFLSLDEQERKLSDEDLMICDGQDNPMCIGGVFGGFNSGVKEETTNIFLESAHFDPSTIRKTSTRHLLRSDAAKVFEKGSDPNITVQVLKRAALLLQEYAGAKVESEIVDVYPSPIKPKEIVVKYANVNRIIGTDISKDTVHDILRAMDMELRPMDNESIRVNVPTNKADVLREIDIIEEILRIYGFNKVPIPTQLKTAINYQNYPTSRDIKNKIADLLAANGFNEMMGLSLIESRMYEDNADHVFINNTSNVHLDIMRPDALLSGLKSVAHNLNHQQLDLRLFEYGRAYIKKEDFVETDFLTLFISGQKEKSNWNNANSDKVDFYDLKKWVNLILDRINISGYQIAETEETGLDFGLKYHRGPNAMVNFGKVDRARQKIAEVKQDVYYACFNLKTLVRGAAKASVKTIEISKYPSTSRDLALVIDEGVNFDKIVGITKKTEKKLISEVSLFDIYKNEEQLGKGKKSYAVKFVFQDSTKTLKDKDVDKVMNKLIENFGSELGAVIRK